MLCLRGAVHPPLSFRALAAGASPSVNGIPESELPQYNLLFTDEHTLREALLVAKVLVTLIAPSR